MVRPDHPSVHFWEKDAPVVMYFHGAGWVMGDATTHDRLVRELAVGVDANVVFVTTERLSIAIQLLSSKHMRRRVMSPSTPKNSRSTRRVWRLLATV